MKKILAILFLFSSIFIFTSCTPQKNQNVVTFATWGSDSEVKILKKVIKEFEDTNPEIKIELLHIPNNYFQKIHLLFASKTAPDIIFLNNYFAKIYIDANLLEPLDDSLTSEDYVPQTLTPFCKDGHIYAVPRDASILAIYVNKDLLKSKGVKIPTASWTFDDFLEKAKILSDQTEGQFAINFEPESLYYLPFLYANEIDLFDLKNTNLVQKLNYYADLTNKYHISPTKAEIGSRTTAQMFLEGKLAMHLSGRWMTPKYRNEAKFDWDIIPFPAFSTSRTISTINLDTSAYALSKSSTNKENSKKFIKFLTSTKTSKMFAQTGLIVPARIDALESSEFLAKGQKPHNAKCYIDILKNSKATTVTPNYSKMNDFIKLKFEPAFLGKSRFEEIITEDFAEKINSMIK